MRRSNTRSNFHTKGVFNNSILGFLIALIAITPSAFAADLSGKKEMASDVIQDIKEMTKETFTDKRNLKIMGVTALGSLILINTEADEDIKDWFDDRGFSSAYGKAGNVLGVSGPILLNLGLYAHGHVKDNDRSTEVARILTTALAVDGISTGAMKIAIGRHRPDDGGSREFDPFTFSNRSFPSGHTSFSFTAATVMAEMYEEKRWVKYTGYTAATLVGIFRIDDESHWASDVLFGAVKGYLIGKTVTKFHKNPRLENVSIIADVRDGDSYVGLGFRF